MQKPDTQDVLSLSGATCIVIGIAIHSMANGFIAAGVFLLIPPGLSIVSGFLRGLRSNS